MKTSKDKAKELVEKLMDHIVKYEEAIECAKIAVDEIINSNPYYFYPGRKVSRMSDHSTKEFWQEVKNELNKM